MTGMSQNKPGKNTANIKDLLRVAAKPLIFLLLLTMVCAFLAHYLTGYETLEEYAQSDPEAAYGSDQADISDAADTNSTDNTADQTDTTDSSGAYNTLEDNSEGVDSMTEITGTADTRSDRVTYREGFYYEPLSDNIRERITGVSYPETGCTVPYEDLAYVGLLYMDFNGEEQTGEMICNKVIAQDIVEIFYELYRNDYRLESVRLVDEYGGDDTRSMEADNTSCFNYRVVDNTTTLSKHAYGCAIDINPFYNPYVIYNKNGSGETYISPKGSEIYADRSQDFPYKIDENDLCYKLFTEHGFTWGGHWNSTKDYQHFQIDPPEN